MPHCALLATCVAVFAAYALGVVTAPPAWTIWLALAPFAGAVTAEFARDRARRGEP